MKKHKHKVSGGFKGDCPAMKVEYQTNEEGIIIGTRRVDHECKDGVYHVTKGWRVRRTYNPHYLLNVLLKRVGINFVETPVWDY